MSSRKYIRDSRSGAVFIRDTEALSKLQMRESLQSQIESLKADINTLKTEIDELKTLMNKSN